MGSYHGASAPTHPARSLWLRGLSQPLPPCWVALLVGPQPGRGRGACVAEGIVNKANKRWTQQGEYEREMQSHLLLPGHLLSTWGPSFPSCPQQPLGAPGVPRPQYCLALVRTLSHCSVFPVPRTPHLPPWPDQRGCAHGLCGSGPGAWVCPNPVDGAGSGFLVPAAPPVNNWPPCLSTAESTRHSLTPWRSNPPGVLLAWDS